MMKRKLIALCLVASTIFVGCSSKGEEGAQDTSGTPTQEEQAKFTGTKSYEALYDSTGKKGDVVVVDVEFKDGEPVAVSIDVRQESGVLKSEASKAGDYVMKQGEEKAWHEQVELLETFIKENGFDLSKVTLTGDNGNTDAVTGVSIKVGSYLEAVQNALDQVK